MRISTNIIYTANPGANPLLQSLDIYAPDQTPKPCPVVAWVHGGGWLTGDKTKDVEHKASFFTQLGYIFVSINYRLSPDVAHPAHAQDVAQSIAWLHNQVINYGGDPQKMVLMGHSSGGHIVSLLGTNARFLLELGIDVQIIRGVLVIDGVGFDVQARMERLQKSFSQMYAQAFGSNPEDWRDASPIHFIGTHKYTPRYLMLCADHSNHAPVAAQMFWEMLKESNITAEVTTISNKDHSTINEDIGKHKEVINMVIQDFLKECFI